MCKLELQDKFTFKTLYILVVSMSMNNYMSKVRYLSPRVLITSRLQLLSRKGGLSLE